MKRRSHWPRLLLLILLLSACSPADRAPGLYETGWRYSDLRLIDAPGGAPGLDLVALYLRGSPDELQIRLDFLDLTHRPEYDLYLALDTASGGSHPLPLDTSAGIAWDTLVTIPASGSISAVTAEGETRPELAVWVQRDPVLDTLTIQLKRLALPRTRFEPGLQVFLTAPGSEEVSDQSDPARLGGSPPPPARALLAFWNAFPAYTPATALRRWDGAHTGPLGGRHGLYNLLRTARNHAIPLALLDLKNPSSLAALDYAGGLELVRELEAAGLLTLPESAPALSGYFPAWVLERAVEESRAAARAYGFPDSQLLYLPPGLEQAWMDRPGTEDHRLVFLGGEEVAGSGRAVITRAGQNLLLASPTLDEVQVDDRGLTLPVRAALAENALAAGSGSPAPLLVLGGDLTGSAWGAPQPAREAFSYLQAHPWVRLLNEQDLLAAQGSLGHAWTAPPSGQGAGGEALSPDSLAVLEDLRNAPPGALTAAAWHALLGLYAPVAPQPAGLEQLRSHYLGQTGALLAASRWEAAPYEQAYCELDFDRDGEAECLLASQEVLALFEPSGGALTYLFVREAGAPGAAPVHQLAAPSSQLAAGLSPASGWDLTRGLQADPAVIPGAFSSTGPFQVQTGPGELVFTAQDGSVQKAYALVPEGLEICIQSAARQVFQVPLVLDPWQRAEPGWWEQYGEQEPETGSPSPFPDSSCAAAAETVSTWKWGAVPAIEVQATAPLRAQTFLDSRRRMGLVEDPNSEFPPGHYLPLSLALLEVETSGTLAFALRLIP